MDALAQLETLFRNYVDTVDDLIRKRKPGEGILGMGGGPKDHPCHEQFDQQVEALIRQLAGSPITAEDASALVTFLLTDEALAHGEQCTQLMLVAVQRHCLPLIPQLSAEDARRLLKDYAARYPLFKRFPAQKEILRALKQQAK